MDVPGATEQWVPVVPRGPVPQASHSMPPISHQAAAGSSCAPAHMPGGQSGSGPFSVPRSIMGGVIANIHDGRGERASVGRHPVILVIDEDRSSRQSLAAMLSIEGFDVITASTSCDAIDSLLSVPPDLVLLDPGWGRDDGLGLVEKVITISPVPVIVVTSGTAEGLNPVLTIERGAADHLVCPLRRKEVVARIRAVLRRVGYADRRTRNNDTGTEREVNSGWSSPAGPDRIA